MTKKPGDLLFDQFREIHSMALQLLEACPELVSSVTHVALKNALADYLTKLEVVAMRVTEIFLRFEVQSDGARCAATAGLIVGGRRILKTLDDPPTRDLMIIAHCLRIINSIIASCETATRRADRLGLEREAQTLNEILDGQEQTADNLMDLEPGVFQLANST